MSRAVERPRSTAIDTIISAVSWFDREADRKQGERRCPGIEARVEALREHAQRAAGEADPQLREGKRHGDPERDRRDPNRC